MSIPDFITSAELRTRLSRYSGVTVPALAGSPPVDPLDAYAAEANAKIFGYLNHWQVATVFDGESGNEPKVLLPIDKSGQGKINFCSEQLFPLTAITEMAIPESAAWTTIQYTLEDLAWNRSGFVQFIPIPQVQMTGWINPVTYLRRYGPDFISGPLPTYPNAVELSIEAGVGTVADLPEMFKSVATELAMLRMLYEGQPDLLLLSDIQVHQSLAGDRTIITSKKDPEGEILAKLRTYSREFYG